MICSNFLLCLKNDLGFISASNDGTIYEFRLDDSSQKVQLMNNTSIVISSVVSCSFEKAIYVAGTDLNSAFPDEKYILEIKYSTKEIKDHENIIHDYGKKYIVSEPTKIFTGANISQVMLLKSNKLFFFGTDEKVLIVFIAIG